jgi:hypothetical protein
MFNLEQSIAEWRRKMATAGITSPAVLDELESHLREDIEKQMRAGAAADGAFNKATQRVGAADELKLEFGKVTRPQPRFSPTAQRVCCLAAAAFVFSVETWTLIIYEVTPATRLFGIAFVSVIAFYIGVLPDLNRKLESGVRGWALRNAIATTCSYATILWVCLLLLDLVHVTLLPSGIILGVVCWALIGAAALTTAVLSTGTTTLDLWSPSARKSFEFADAEAVRFRHDFIGTEHVLLGLMAEPDGSVSKVLGKMGVQRETVRAEIEKIIGSGPQSQKNCPLVYTPRAKKAIRIAIQEAKAARHNHVQPEHIFLGLLREGGGVAAKVLTTLGVNATNARTEILKKQGDH